VVKCKSLTVDEAPAGGLASRFADHSVGDVDTDVWMMTSLTIPHCSEALTTLLVLRI
jgi:hypothetical protein